MAFASRGLVLVAGFCLGTSGIADAQVHRLAPRDFVVAGIRDNYPHVDVELDMAEVRETLGSPLEIRRYEFQPGDTITAWRYDGLVVEFGVLSRIGIALTSSRVATERGLRVGDTEQRLTALYGLPSRREDSDWIYEDPRERLHVICFTVRGQKVERIYIGSIWD